MTDPTLRHDDTWNGPRSEGPGSVIGPYTLLRLIGEGGFGDVYEAQQSEPVQRRVALKLVKLGMDTREVIARFERERQSLAMMEHPHIAQVFDAGATAGGRPYFVMEYVDGVPITEFCAARALTVDALLGLFAQVCAAIQHAHTKGVIHRDLKPSNVLVGMHDGQAFTKVIDFGIAKATGGESRERTLATALHQVMGTPLYMSPEQAIGSPDIDTRTDIYSLGVILYELLTGTTPVERERLQAVSLADTQRLIRDSEPPRPSARILQNATTLTGSATFRPADPRKLARTIRGDLDWIVMKSLEKEPARRYQSAADFNEDIRRYLAGDAVLAVPPSLGYRTRKFIRRNKGAVIAASLIGLSLLAGIVAFAWQAHLAQKRADDLAQVTAFDASIFAQIDAAKAGQRLAADVRQKFAADLRRQGLSRAELDRRLAAFDADWTHVNATDAARDVIDESVLRPAAASIDRRFARQPLLAAQLQQSLASRYSDMGMFDAALPLEMAALVTRRRLLGENSLETAKSEFAVGTILLQNGELTRAEPFLLRALKTARARLGEDSEDTLAVVGNLALVYSRQGDLARAEPYYRQVLEGRRRVLGQYHPDTLLASQNLGSLLREEGKFDQAEPFLREAAAAQEKVSGPDADNTLYALGNLALLDLARGQYAGAEKQIGIVLDRSRRVHGEDHPTTLLASIIMGSALERQGKHQQTQRLLAGIAPVADNALVGGNGFWNGMLHWHLGRARTALGDYAQAETDLLKACELLAVPHVVEEPNDLRECTRSLVALYAAWDKAEPGKGYGAKAAQWQAKLDALKTAATK